MAENMFEPPTSAQEAVALYHALRPIVLHDLLVDVWKWHITGVMPLHLFWAIYNQIYKRKELCSYLVYSCIVDL